MAHDAPATSRFRAFTTSIGLTSTTARSPPNQSSSLLRPVSAASLRSLYGNFTLYLRVHSAQQLPAVTQSSYCKLYLGDSPMVGGFGRGKSLLENQDRRGSSHQTFHTKVQMGAQRGNPEWNEKFQLNVRDPQTEILTIRVKNHVLIYSPAIGACVVHLRQLQLGETVDEWFPLHKNDKASGQLRLQLCLQQNGEAAVPERRYSQPSGEEMQRMIQNHREQQENARRETEQLQQEKWKQMEEEKMKHVGLREQKDREEKWKERREKHVEDEREEQPGSDLELPASFKNRGFKKEEEDIASQLMRELDLKESVQKQEANSEMSSGYTVYNSAEFGDRGLTSFGTIRLSTEELDRVVQNALPTSDSSESVSDQERRHRKLKNRKDNKHSRRKSKKHSKRRVYSDESSDTSSERSGGYREKASRIKIPEEKCGRKTSIPGSGSSQSQRSTQNESRHDWDIPSTLSFPPSPSDEASTSSEEESSRRRRRRRAEKARKREKERKRRAKRKSAKSRRSYDSSDSPSASSVSSSSSISSSEEERLRRKLNKKKAKKAKARALLAERGGSRASRRSSGIQHSQKLSYADLGAIDDPYMTQQSRPNGVGSFQNNDVGDCAASTVTSTFFGSSTTQQQPLYSSKVPPTNYGPDGVSFDEPEQPATPQYPRQATKEQTNSELMRSFCF